MQQVDDGVVIGIKGHSIGRFRPFPILFGDWPDTSNYPDVPWIVSGRREGYKLGQDQTTGVLWCPEQASGSDTPSLLSKATHNAIITHTIMN